MVGGKQKSPHSTGLRVQAVMAPESMRGIAACKWLPVGDMNGV